LTTYDEISTLKRGCSRIIIDSIVRLLEETLGNVGSEMVLYYLQNKHQVRLEDALLKPELFEETLKVLLGSCAELILREAVKLSSSKMKYDLGTEEGVSFTTYIKKVIAHQEE